MNWLTTMAKAPPRSLSEACDGRTFTSVSNLKGRVSQAFTVSGGSPLAIAMIVSATCAAKAMTSRPNGDCGPCDDTRSRF